MQFYIILYLLYHCIMNQASSSSFIIADDGGSGSGGATAFTGLSDTPANFGSAAGKTLKVNSGGKT